MMYPRLELLKELLHDDGAIFISIDDNELRYLLLICDQVFGPENRFGLIVVKNNPRGRRLGTELAVEHEYLVVYARNNSKFKAGRIPLTDEQIAEYSEVDNDGRKYRLLGLRKRGALSRRIDRPNLHFPLYVNTANRGVSLQKSKNLVEVIPRLSDGSEGVWRWSGRKIDEEADSLIAREVKRRDTGLLEWDVFEKDYLEPAEGRLFPSLWLGSEFNYETGTDQIKEILGKVDFPYPKPVDLVKHAILLSGATDGFVLDSFAGSGTTGQAVLELNASNGANRKFILVQMPHETKEQEQKGVNICKNITAERVTRVAIGYTYKTQKGKKVAVAGLGGTFTYAGVGKPLFDEYRNLGKTLPPYDELAKYIFYGKETSSDFDKKALNPKTGKIGEHRKTSYYLLYTPNNKEDQALDLEWLKSIEKSEKNRNIVVYCEKIWIHRDDLAKYERDTGRKVRQMLIPFNLK